MSFLAFLLCLSWWAGALHAGEPAPPPRDAVEDGTPAEPPGALELRGVLQTLADYGNSPIYVSFSGSLAKAALQAVCEAGPPTHLVVVTDLGEPPPDPAHVGGEACLVSVDDATGSVAVRIGGSCRAMPPVSPSSEVRLACTKGTLPSPVEASAPAPVSEAGASCPDADGDGYTARSCGGRDCDDGKVDVNPGGLDIPDDGIDQDCDGYDTRIPYGGSTGEVVGLTCLKVLGFLVLSILAGLGTLVVILIIVSCPFVYVETPEGWRLAGEAFSGAAVRALQRTDLVPLPVAGRGTVRVRISAVSEETDHIDRAALVVVDHDRALHALATPDARPVLLGPSRGPTTAVDLAGRDVLALLADDEWFWETDMDRALDEPGAASGEGLVVTFRDPPVGPDGLALELHTGNTPWEALLSAAVWSSMGDLVGRFQRRGRDVARRERLLMWREDAGLDLVVERRVGADAWEEVAVVPPPGWANLRRLCVPLPAGAGPDLTLRLRGGTGFWRIQHLALAPVVDADPPFRAVHAGEAPGFAGTDERAVLERSDGAYSTLPGPGRDLVLTFDAGPGLPGTTRTAFLAVDGFYEVHERPDARLRPRLAWRLKHHPEWISELSLGAYRAWAEATEEVAIAGPGGS